MTRKICYDAELINNLKNMHTTCTDFNPITFEEMEDMFLSQIISRSKEINAEAIYLDYRLILRRQKELNLIETFHENGIEVNAWTVNKKEEMQMLIDLDVDRITTDRLDLLIQLRESVS